jgi:predicted small integral membrane protein
MSGSLPADRRLGLPHPGHRLGALGTLPVACTVLTAINGLYILLVVVGNIRDYDTNYAFVQHVLAMDTTNFGGEPGVGLDPDIIGRAITTPAVQTAAYLAIILWEALTAVLFLAATALWLGALRSRQFTHARRVATSAFLMLVILFMGGFITIGGEWFQMWRSDEWNGLQPAFQNTTLALFGLVLIHLPSALWAEEPASPLTRP